MAPLFFFMKIEKQLERSGPNYGVFVDSGTKGKPPFFRKFMCLTFVASFFGTEPPNKITVSLSDVGEHNATALEVSRTGYYRWYIRKLHGGYCRAMFISAEEIVAKFFPELGQHELGQLWINIH